MANFIVAVLAFLFKFRSQKGFGFIGWRFIVTLVQIDLLQNISIKEN